MDKKETGEYEEEKGTGSEAKKMGNERMGENEEVCPFENILFCPGTKNPEITCFPRIKAQKSRLILRFSPDLIAD